LEQNAVLDAETPILKIRRLIYGRLAIVFLLLLTSWWWTSNIDYSLASFPHRLFLLFLFAIALTLFYLSLSRFHPEYIWQIRLQFVIDIVLITWLVGETGESTSPYVTLYIVLISSVGYFLGKFETILFAVLSTTAFSIISIASRDSLLSSLTPEVPVSRFLQVVAFNSVGILIVGLLAGHLSERRNVVKKLKETEESFDDLHFLHERIVESISAGLITTDLAGKIRTLNRAAAELTGFEATDAKGESVYRLFDDNIRPSVDLCLHRAGEGRSFPAAHFESLVTRNSKNDAGENQSTVACTVTPLMGKKGMVNGLLLSFQDITQIRAMEKSLRRADRLAVVGRMAAGLAHEIRNPLGSMSSAMQFLEENVKAATPEAELLGVVLRESDRLNEIISNFLTYAQLSVGGLAKDKLELTNVGDAIKDCLVLLQHSREINDSFVLNADLPEAPVTIMANQAQVKQVFWNLFQNSIHAMPDGGNLDIILKDFAGKHISITIKDTGCGMSPENIEHLYEPFISSTNGSGLGLSIVHNIIRDHGGRIDVQSKKDKGTTISVEFPY